MSRPVLPAIPVVVVSLGNVSEKCSLAALLWWRTTSDSFQCHFLRWRAGSGLFPWGVASGNRHEKGNFYFNLVTIPVYHWLSSSFPFLFSFHPIPKAIMKPTSNCPQSLAGARGLLQVRSALEMFQESTGCSSQNVFFYMCFFTNNQYRMIVENSSNGSDNLEDVFESNLKRIGCMIAILDTWDQPVYLSRVWTVYEQFVASTLQIEVRVSFPTSQFGSVLSETLT